jgi:hypothetical protein
MFQTAQATSGKLAAGTKSRLTEQYRKTRRHVKQIPNPQHLAQAADVLVALGFPLDGLEESAFWHLLDRRLRRAYKEATR